MTALKRALTSPIITATATGPRRSLLVLAGLALAGIALAWWLSGTFAGRPDPRTSYSVFYVIFARGEPLGLAVVALFSITAAVFLFRKKMPDDGALEVPALERSRLFLIGALVFVVAALGTTSICHDYALSADEYMADFQAQIFMRGKVTAEVPAQWLPAVRLIKPTYADYLPATHSWKAAYLPAYAAMRALFQSVYLQSFLNPLLAAITVFALHGAARNIWPNEKQNALVAALLLAASSQFLVMAMTAYSMPAHLALNTIWLWLYSRPDRRRFYLAPVVGVLAIGLHQPIVHALFAAPFLLRLVRQRKWRAVSIFGLLYSLGCITWFLWRAHYSPADKASMSSFFRLLNPRMLVIQPMDLLLIIGWSTLATPLLIVLGFGRIFRQRSDAVDVSLCETREHALPHPRAAQSAASTSPAQNSRYILQDAALSCLLTFGFYYFFYIDQGHGWGYRYFHGTLSCLILVAVAGWESLGEKVGARAARNFLGAGVAASLLITLPLRCYQAETFIRPFARASEMIHSINAELVGVNPLYAWYSADLIRNDPFLENRPIVAAAIPGWLTAAEIETLAQAGKARLITREELDAAGLATTGLHRYRRDPFRLGYGK